MTQLLAPTSELSDADALQRFADFGDADAFRLIAQRHASMVYATCLRVTGDMQLADDASQEVFFRLLRRSHEINQSLAGWLHRTATHVALDLLRSESARHRREVKYARELGDEATPREASSWAELSPVIDAVLAEMPESPRMLLIEHYLQGKTQATLAAESGQSPATVCRRVQDALADLRARLRLRGVSTLPAILAALLCQVHARQAPAAVVKSIGKMVMYRGAVSLGYATGGAIQGRVAPTGPSTLFKLAALACLTAAATFGGMRMRAMLFPDAPQIVAPAPEEASPRGNPSVRGCSWISHEPNPLIRHDSRGGYHYSAATGIFVAARIVDAGKAGSAKIACM